MIATFIDLSGHTFVREIKKLEKVITYINNDSAEYLKVFFGQQPIPTNIGKTQTYILQTVTNNIPVYKEVINEWKDAAAAVPSKPVVIVEQPKKVEIPIPIDTSFEDMYKKLKG